MAKKKTPQFLVELINQHIRVLQTIDEILRVKREAPIENQAPHVRDRTEAEHIAFANGNNAMLETALHAYGCYAGFGYRGPLVKRSFDDGSSCTMPAPILSLQDPNFAEWRREYFTR